MNNNPQPKFNLGDLVDHKPGYFEGNGLYNIIGRAFSPGEFNGWVYIIDAPGDGDGLAWIKQFESVSFLPELETSLNHHSSSEGYMELANAPYSPSEDAGLSLI